MVWLSSSAFLRPSQEIGLFCPFKAAILLRIKFVGIYEQGYASSPDLMVRRVRMSRLVTIPTSLPLSKTGSLPISLNMRAFIRSEASSQGERALI